MFDWPDPPLDDDTPHDADEESLWHADARVGLEDRDARPDDASEPEDAPSTQQSPTDYTFFGNLITLSAYRGMWVFAMFDLPVDTKEARKRYTRFRKALLRNGFCMLQFSVYARHCASEDSTEGVRNAVRAELPPDGQVRLLGVTDRQFGKMEVYFGKTREKTEDPPAQFMLF